MFLRPHALLAALLPLACLLSPAAHAQQMMNVLEDDAPDDGRVITGTKLAACVGDMNRLRVGSSYAGHAQNVFAWAQQNEGIARDDLDRSTRDSWLHKDATERFARFSAEKRKAQARHDEVRLKMEPVMARFHKECFGRSVRKSELIAAGGTKTIFKLQDEDVDGLRANALD